MQADLTEPDALSLDEAERRRIIAETIEGLRERLQQDGGDMTLVSIEGPRVRVRLSGACAGCGLVNGTLGWVRKRLSQALGGRPISVLPDLSEEARQHSAPPRPSAPAEPVATPARPTTRLNLVRTISK